MIHWKSDHVSCLTFRFQSFSSINAIGPLITLWITPASCNSVQKYWVLSYPHERTAMLGSKAGLSLHSVHTHFGIFLSAGPYVFMPNVPFFTFQQSSRTARCALDHSHYRQQCSESTGSYLDSPVWRDWHIRLNLLVYLYQYVCHCMYSLLLNYRDKSHNVSWLTFHFFSSCNAIEPASCSVDHNYNMQQCPEIFGTQLSTWAHS